MKSNRLAIIGAGELGRLIAHYANQTKISVAGYIDDFANIEESPDGLKVLGRIDAIPDLFAQGHFDTLICGIGYNHLRLRQRIFEEHSSKIPFQNVIAPSTYLDPSASLGSGCLILPGSVIDKNAFVGDNTVLNCNCTISHDCMISGHSFFGPGVTLSGKVEIGPRCFIGIGTSIIDGIKVAPDVQTGGGTVVTKDLATSGLYVGVPARKILS